MIAPLTLEQAARIIGLLLHQNLLGRHDVIAWADRHITEMPNPPLWLLQLSTSHDQWPWDAARYPLSNSTAVPPELACGVVLALMPSLEEIPNENLKVFAKLLYDVVTTLCENDWTETILRDANRIDDEFALIERGSIQGTLEGMRKEMESFLLQHALPEQASSLDPIRIRLSFERG